MPILFKALVVAGMVILIAITGGFGLFDAEQTERVIFVLCFGYVVLTSIAQSKACCGNGA